jgi:hypothetical protein
MWQKRQSTGSHVAVKFLLLQAQVRAIGEAVAFQGVVRFGSSILTMWQTLLTPVDLYCERTGPGLWAEPANALTNLAFIAAGLWGVWQVRRYRTGAFAEVLAWWVVAIVFFGGLGGSHRQPG